jgi:hypothetical protein
MRFKFEHTFDVGVEDLEKAMFNPALPEFLEKNMGSLKEMKVLEREESDASIDRKVRYVPEPLIKKVGPKKVPPEAMIWVENSHYDKSSREMSFDNVPTHPQVVKLMTNKGTIKLHEVAPGRSKRVMEGELKVKVPILGRVAEKMIFKTAKKVIEEEAKALADFLEQLPSD